MVFLRFEISWVFAFSPRYLLLGPNPTSDGVARFEVSLAICGLISWRSVATLSGPTYNVNALIPGDTDLGSLTTQIYSDDRHFVQFVVLIEGGLSQRNLSRCFFW